MSCEFLFLDLDDTILDFGATEKKSISRLLEAMGITPTDELLRRYHVINLEHWQQLERGEITRDQINNRFHVLFAELGKQVDALHCEALYRRYLSEDAQYMPGAEGVVERLSKKYRLFLASNGTASVQHGRLAITGLGKYFEGIFISEEVGANKPSKEFFQRSFAQIPDFDPAKAMIVGDSKTSDILGGIHAGIATCWVNFRQKLIRPEIVPDYEIASISELEALLEA